MRRIESLIEQLKRWISRYKVALNYAEGKDRRRPTGWKRKVVEAIERSAHVARVFLLVARADEGWVTIPSYANKNGPPRFEPLAKYEKWLAKPLAVLPASDLLSFVYKKCEQIRNGSDNSGSRKKP